MRGVFIFILIVLTGRASAAQPPCEAELTRTRYRDDFKDLRRRGVFWDVNPAFYRNVHGGTRIYNQTFEQLEQPLRPAFNHVQEDFSSAVARFLLLSGAVQVRVRGEDGKPLVTHLWLNGRPWKMVLEQIENLDATAALQALGEMATDRTRLGLPPMDRSSLVLEESAALGEEMNIFALEGRDAQTLQLRVRRRVAEALERFMDYRTAQDVLNQMTRDGLVWVQLETTREGLSDGGIRIVDAHGFKRPLNSVMEDLRKWYAHQNEIRARAARSPGREADRTPERLVSRIYDRPDSTPMDRSFWKKFGRD